MNYTTIEIHWSDIAYSERLDISHGMETDRVENVLRGITVPYPKSLGILPRIRWTRTFERSRRTETPHEHPHAVEHVFVVHEIMVASTDSAPVETLNAESLIEMTEWIKEILKAAYGRHATFTIGGLCADVPVDVAEVVQ